MMNVPPSGMASSCFFSTGVVEVDAGGDDQGVVAEGLATLGGDGLLGGIDGGDFVHDDVDATLGKAVIADLQAGQIALAGEDFVGQRAGGVDRVLFDQGDLDGGAMFFQILRGGGAAVTTADDDDAGFGTTGAAG